MNKTNSAKKLYDIFKNLIQKDEKSSMNQVWADILGADASNTNDLVDKIFQVLNLTNDLKDDINSMEIDEEEKSNFLGAVSKIQFFMLRNDLYGSKIGSINIPGYFSLETLSIISSCGTLMNATSRGFNDINEDEIASFKEELNNLLEKTSSLSIDDKTKKFIVRKIKDILNVIDNYQIRGSSGLDKVIKKSLGDIFIHLSIHPEEKEKLTVLINTILKVNGLINAAEKVSPLIQDAVKLLLGGN
jgi:hypothetical protein